MPFDIPLHNSKNLVSFYDSLPEIYPAKEKDIKDTLQPDNSADEQIEILQRNVIQELKYQQRLREISVDYANGIAAESEALQNKSAPDAVIYDLNKSSDKIKLRAAGVKPMSSNELMTLHEEVIASVRDTYVAIYADSVDTLNKFQSKFNELKLALAKYVDAGKGQGEITLKMKEFVADLEKLLSDFSGTGGQLFPVEKDGQYPTASKAEAEKWLTAMGLPISCLKDHGNGAYTVQINLEPLNSMLTSTKQLDSNWSPDKEPGYQFKDLNLNAAKHSAWDAGFQAKGEEYPGFLQTMSTKLQGAKASMDQLVKLMSTFIQQNAEAAMAYLRF